jgi:hypothetical protein
MPGAVGSHQIHDTISSTLKQIMQSLKTDQTILERVPAPSLLPGAVLIQTTRTLISAGIERSRLANVVWSRLQRRHRSGSQHR